jgi:hypothetical protein
MIEMRNGGVIWYRTRTGPGGRGVDDIDRLVVDEAQHATEEHLAAMTPTLLANSNPQMNILGTAGLDGKSEWWWHIRRRALSPDPGAFGYVGHTADRVRIGPDGRVVQDEVDVSDRAVWLDANPAVVAGRGQGLPFLEEQLLRLGSASFAREHLCVWDPPSETGEGDIPADVWAAELDPLSEIATHCCYALDVSPDHRWAAFGAAGLRGDGRIHVEVGDHRPRTGWVLARGVELWQKHHLPIRIDKTGPAKSFIAKLKAKGVEVVDVSADEVSQACGQFIDAALNDDLRHLGQTSLDGALKAAVLKKSGDASLWGRRLSKSDICSLVAVTVAVGGVPQVSSPQVFVWNGGG